MARHSSSYRGHRFPAEIISHAVWLYYRFSLSLRDVEDLLAQRGVVVSHESVRQLARKFGTQYAGHWFVAEAGSVTLDTWKSCS
jgi:putative transposase